MGKFFKFLIGSILCLFLFVAGGIGVIYHYRFDLMKKSIEEMASEFLETQVSFGQLDVNSDENSFSIRDINIKNPVGFSDRNALTFGEITFAINPENTDENIIWIKEFTLKDINILYEYDEKISKSNISVLKGSDAEQSYYSSNKRISEISNDSTADSENAVGKTMRLDDFNFQSVKITVLVNKKEFSIPLPDIIIHDVGNGESLPPDEFISGIISKIPEKTWKEINDAKEVLKEAGDKNAAEVFDTLSELQNSSSAIETLIYYLNSKKK